MTAVLAVGIQAQAGDPATLIQAKLVSQVKVTKPTADHSDIVTAGDVVVLQKDGLMMCSSSSSYAFSNSYSAGTLTANYNNRGQQRLRIAQVRRRREILGHWRCRSKRWHSGQHLFRSLPRSARQSGSLLRRDQIPLPEGFGACARRLRENLLGTDYGAASRRQR